MTSREDEIRFVPGKPSDGGGWWTARPVGIGFEMRLQWVEQADQWIVRQLLIQPQKGEQAGDPSPAVPAGGVDSRLLREISLSTDRQRVTLAASTGVLASLGRPFPPAEVLLAALVKLDYVPTKGKARPDALLALVSALYVIALDEDPVRPVRLVSSWSPSLTPAHVRDAVRAARDRGLLTEATHGRSGGALTPQGQVLLQQALDQLAGPVAAEVIGDPLGE